MKAMLRQVGMSGGHLGIFALLLLFTAFPAYASEVPTPSEVSEYAKDFDVSAREAEEKLETQHRGTAIVAELKLALGEEYAGVWFDNEKGDFVILLPQGAARETVAAKLSAMGLSDYRTAPAESSWSELEAAQKRLDVRLRALVGKGLVQTFLDSRTNAVVVRQARSANQSQRVAIASTAHRERAKVQVRPQEAERLSIQPQACLAEFAICDKPLRGGVGIWPSGEYEGASGTAPCTAGFKAVGNTYGNRFVLTAGHCAVALGSHLLSFTATVQQHYIGEVQQYIIAPTSDYAKINANGSWWDDTGSWPVKVAYWGTNQERTINYEAYSYIGQYVCHAGANSGASCGTVTALNLLSHQPPGEIYDGDIYNRTEFQTICSKGGDSGGPVFAGDAALGIFTHNNVGVEGETPEYCHEKGYYTEITEAADAMGLTVGYRVGGAPFATTKQVSDVSSNQATANADVNPNSVETSYHFEYGKTTAYGSAVPAPNENVGHGTGAVGVNTTLSNLEASTTYHYRVVATSEAGTSYGGDVQFTTPAEPTPAVMSDASGIQHIYYRGPGDQLNEWYGYGSSWTHKVWGYAGLMSGDPTVMEDPSNNRRWVYYRGPSGEMRSWWFQGPDWNEQSWGYSGRVVGTPTSIEDPSNNRRWVYYRGPSGEMRSWWFQGPDWNEQSWGYSGLVAGNPTSVRDPSNNRRWVYYRGPSGEMRSWWFQGSDWNEQSWGAGGALGGDPVASLNASKNRNVFYFDKHGVLYKWWFSGSSSGLYKIG